MFGQQLIGRRALRAGVRRGLLDAYSGRFIDHARLKAKWDKKLAIALDKAR